MKEIPLTKGYTALIDDEDYERVSADSWCATPRRHTTYVLRSRRINGKKSHLYLHRFILDVTDPAIQVDHINHNGLDCRKANLRTCTRQQNHHNRRKHMGVTSRFKGVYYDPSREAWRAGIFLPTKRPKQIGRFKTELTAALAYDIAARSVFGDFAATNFQLCPLTIQGDITYERNAARKN